MTDLKCLAAFTANIHPYPPYINVSADEHNVVVTVRAMARTIPQPTECGDTAAIVLPAAVFDEILAALNAARPAIKSPDLGFMRLG